MFNDLEISALVVGIVQVVKLLVTNLSAKAKLGVALAVGVILLTLAELVNGGYLSAPAVAIVLSVVRVLGYAVAIPGWFSAVKDEILPAVGS